MGNIFQKRIKIIGFIICGVIVGIVLLECGLRFSGYLIHIPKNMRNMDAAQGVQDIRILCIGESTTDSQWPQRLEVALRERGLADYRFSIFDEGMTSVDTARLLAELPAHMQRYDPQLVIAMVGINDYPDTIAYTFSLSDRITLFFSSLRITKLAAILYQRTRFSFYKIGEAIAAPDLFETKKNEIFSEYQDRDKDGGYYHALGELYYSYYKYDEAIALLKEGIQRQPESPELFTLLVLCYCDSGKIDLARECAQEALTRMPDQRALLIAAGRSSHFKILEEMEKGKKQRDSDLLKQLDDEVEAYFLRAYKLDPANLDNLETIVSYYIEKKEDEVVAELLDEIKSYQAENGSIYDSDLVFNIAESLMRTGDFKKARELYAEGITLHPEKPAFYRGYALCSLELKDQATAEIYFDKISQTGTAGYFDGTIHNINLMKKVVESCGATFVAMQYPIRSIDTLKNMIKVDATVIYVDNGQSFRDAVYHGQWREYFVDNFGFDFGHCTPKGNRLIARNVAQTLAETYFKREI